VVLTHRSPILSDVDPHPDGTSSRSIGVVRSGVKEALRLDRLRAGDRLPVVRDVVATSGVNANTVLKAYRELEHAGLAEIRQGCGTFVTAAMAAIDSEILNERRASMSTWVAQARAAGITDDMATLLRNALTAEGTRRRHVTGWSGSTYRSNATAAGSPVANAVAL